ncbi:Intradiol ring-cleavage dioxygenase [Schizophyllum amplum]|uniref:Intradiol ring-cleavage dioxygenase n=1 Tax=Schizophyllum amplum TaxID=97359 RepID=A0A550CZ79_9AGAR|nr:Intradiol ring-cleavage dioxygenase [Auriculariopsis ampla]
MVFAPSVFVFAAVSLAGLSSAHPHHAVGSPEFIKRDNLARATKRSLGDCQAELRKRGGLYERSVSRREALAEDLRSVRGLKRGVPYKRDFDTVLNTDHKSNLTGVTNNTEADTLFAGNSACILAPDVTEGPYYVDGEFVRWDIREDQAGVDLYVDVQVIDVSTCEPVSDIYIDFWHANSTGVYAGVTAENNGNGDESNLNSTFLRGIQATNEDGVAQWLTTFPGHYTGRTAHIHVATHTAADGTLNANGTYKSETVSFVGQMFFDQSLISEVEATEPYSSNTQALTTNEEDGIMEQEAETIDPIVEYVLLGDDISEGIMAWTAFGIDLTNAYTISAAASYTEDGGVANESSGGPGGAPPGGDMPSGSAPGAVPSSSAASFA